MKILCIPFENVFYVDTCICRESSSSLNAWLASLIFIFFFLGCFNIMIFGGCSLSLGFNSTAELDVLCIFSVPLLVLPLLEILEVCQVYQYH